MKALQNNSIPAQLVAVPGEIHACENEPFGVSSVWCVCNPVFSVQCLLLKYKN